MYTKIISEINNTPYKTNEDLLEQYGQEIIMFELDNDMEEYNNYIDRQISKTKNYDGYYYHFSKNKTMIMNNGFDINKMEQVGVGYGLYLGKDKEAIDGFYGFIVRENYNYDELENTGIIIYELYDDIKWLDLTDEKLFQKYTNKISQNNDTIEDITLQLGYDGIRYYDVLATGEEFVLYNLNKIKNYY